MVSHGLKSKQQNFADKFNCLMADVVSNSWTAMSIRKRDRFNLPLNQSYLKMKEKFKGELNMSL